MMPISAAPVVARKQWPRDIPGFAGWAIFSSESALLSSGQAARTVLKVIELGKLPLIPRSIQDLP